MINTANKSKPCNPDVEPCATNVKHPYKLLDDWTIEINTEKLPNTLKYVELRCNNLFDVWQRDGQYIKRCMNNKEVKDWIDKNFAKPMSEFEKMQRAYYHYRVDGKKSF